jgi:hypothetical protein
VAGDGLRSGAGESADFPTEVKEVVAMCAESTIGDPPCDLLNAPHIGVPTQEVNEKLDDEHMFTHGFRGILFMFLPL